MPGYSAVIKVIEAEVEDYAKEEREVEQGEVRAILFCGDPILHDAVYAEYPEGFDQQIGKDEQ
jgi:hypothetical protein